MESMRWAHRGFLESALVFVAQYFLWLLECFGPLVSCNSRNCFKSDSAQPLLFYLAAVEWGKAFKQSQEFCGPALSRKPLWSHHYYSTDLNWKPHNRDWLFNSSAMKGFLTSTCHQFFYFNFLVSPDFIFPTRSIHRRRIKTNRERDSKIKYKCNFFILQTK